MRAIDAPERALLASDHNVHLLLEVQNADGSWIDLSIAGGHDWCEGAEWGTDIDQAVEQGTIFLRREIEGDSLAPMIELSGLNRDAGGAYAPLLYPGRRFRLKTAVTSPGAAPVTWREVLTGRIDRVRWPLDPIEVVVSDLGVVLLKTFIERVRVYGSGAGTAVETAMQQIIDDNVPNPPTLYVPTTPGWMIHEYEQEKVAVLQALRDLAIQIGWEVRYLYDAAGVSRLTLFEPVREPVATDDSFGPDEYYDVKQLEVSDDDIRNAVRVTYTDATLGRRSEERFVQASIDQFGRRFMEIEEAETSNIDTATEAAAMAAAAVADLAFPIADQEIESGYFWPAQVADYFGFLANGVHYDVDQEFGVVGYRHSLHTHEAFTSFRVRGKPVGAFRRWLVRGSTGGVSPDEPTNPAPPPDVTLSLNGSGNLVVDLAGTGLESFRVLVSFHREPAPGDVRVYGVIENDNPGQIIAMIGDNERRYVAVFGYTEDDAGGLESLLTVEHLDRGATGPPTAAITDLGPGDDPNTEAVRYLGELGSGEVGPLEWRREVRRDTGGVVQIWTAWEEFHVTQSPVDIVSRIAPFPRHNVVFLEVRDQASGTTTQVSLDLPPQD